MSVAPPERAVCIKCLDERGFYKKPGFTYSSSNRDKFVFSGKMLNFNPPKYVILKKVMRDVIADLKRMRVGYSIFDGNPKLSSGDGAKLLKKQAPQCSVIADDPDAFDDVRADYINGLLNLSFDSNTPLAESLYDVGLYFTSSTGVYSSYGFDRFKNAYEPNIGDESRGWCWGCQATSIIIISDGEPTQDTSVPITAIRTANGGSVKCPDRDGNGSADCSDHYLDDVAKFLHNRDLQAHSPTIVGDMNTAGLQTVNVYGIALSNESPILRNATEGVGGGLYIDADDADTLKQAITDVLSAVKTRATSFASASVASFQVNSTSGSVLARLEPSRGGGAQPWRGYLYRFELGPEVIAGCDPATAATVLSGGSGDAKDFNKDGDCSDVYLFDMDPATGKVNDPVLEDDQGRFVKLADPATPATPFWEAGAVLKPAGKTEVWKTRKIYTIVDDSGPTGSPDNKIDTYDTPIEFSEANAEKLRDHLGIGDNPAECASLGTAIGETLDSLACAQLIIRWYRGADALNPDPDQRDYDRDFLLGDIFHSAPIVVDPLADKFMCGTGGQCLPTLFEGKTPLDPDGSGGADDAYEEALEEHGDRDRIVLVGSNGGMLHAFHSGGMTGTDPDTGLPTYDGGTGEELWAFIPPDLLPKLRTFIGRHGYFVDGTAMVRDVWLDDNNDGKKQKAEFRTVAIMNEGTGGTKRFALDLTDLIGRTGAATSTRAHRPPNEAGDFLWLWPQPCDELSMLVGESTGNFAPKPPAIGPVAIKDEAGPYEINGVEAREQWIVFFNGGNDPNMLRGRGMAIVNIADGSTLWSFFSGDGSTNSDGLRYPIAAPMAMLDVGNAYNSTPDQDLLFDTATVGDYGGAVWTVRFWMPGELDADGKVTNWFAARSFEIDAGSGNAVRPAFAQMTSNVLQPDTGYLRTFIGSGDRNNLTDKPGEFCRLGNPRACARQGCSVERSLTVERGGSTVFSGDVAFASGQLASGSLSTAAGGAACLGTKVVLEYDNNATTTCAMNVDGRTEVVCDGTSSSWSCRTVEDDWVATNLQQLSGAPTTSEDKFFGFWSYGVSPTRMFNSAAEADDFDNASNLLTSSKLVDVTNVDASGLPTGGTSGQLGEGWYVSYSPLEERTGSGSTILDGCVLWNSFEPGTGASLCATTGNHMARFYQAGYVHGAANCAASFNEAGTWSRFVERSVVAVPGEPAPQRSVFGGTGTTSIVTLEAGRNQVDSVSEEKELVQSIYEIQVDRTTHDCRHEGVGCP